MADKETSFLLSLWTDFSETQHFIFKLDTPCTTTSLMVDTRANKMKSWDVWKVWEVHHRRLLSGQQKRFLCQYWHHEDPGIYSTVHAINIACFLYPGELWTARKCQSLQTATRNKFEHIMKAQYDLKLHGTISSCLEEATNKARSLHVAQESATQIDPLLHVRSSTCRGVT